MKKKIVIIVCAAAILLLGIFIWWKIPVHLLKGTAPSDIQAITVFDGNIGKGFTIDAPEEIAYIVTNIQNAEMTRGKISLGYTGYRFRLSFPEGSGVAEFVINSRDTIRKDPFFYTDAASALCYDYLEELEAKYLNEEKDISLSQIPENPEQDIATQGVYDYPAMIMVDNILYYDSGEISTELRCGMADGQITDMVNGEPTQNNQSNFGTGYGYQYGAGTIEVCIDDEWHIFIPYEKNPTRDWNTLSEEERMELDPTYQGSAEGNALMKNASPDTSALALYLYDGKTITRWFLFDNTAEKEAINEISSISAVKADGWSPEQIKLPVYGLEIGNTEGWDIQAAWSNGYWIAQDGTVYRFDYDFEALRTDYKWENKDVFETISVLPCSRILSRNEEGWFANMLSPAGELTPPEGISMKLISRTTDAITVEFSNQSEEEWAYGKYFSLHTLLDGVWYVVPTVPGNWAFEDIAMILPAGKKHEETYYLSMYGKLPTGDYRLAAEGLEVRFWVE